MGFTKSEQQLQDDMQQLREENSRLKALLQRHGLTWEKEHESIPSLPAPVAEPTTKQRSTSDKIALFRHLFRGREDVYPLRWESARGRSGYSPACGNEWKPGVCHKPRIKCGECTKRQLLPFSDKVIFDHLTGKHTIGVYPLLNEDRCCFLAVDFDKGEWREDAGAFMQSCRALNIPAALEISRSGKGAHVWIFFAEAVFARDARLLGAALISHACERTRQLSLASYDRLFPNQDIMPNGGFGNLIALPLQQLPREHGCSVFVNEQFEAYPDQWAFLSSIQLMSGQELEDAILRASGGRHPLDVAFISEEESRKPWQRPKPVANILSCPVPTSLTLVLANQIFIAKQDVPQPLANRLIRLAAFQNPEFYKAQAMRFPVWDKPRIIGCAENFPQHIALPRGCLKAVLALLEQNRIRAVIQDERLGGCKVPLKFIGTLRKDQKKAASAMMKSDVGVLSAPTAFGKTVVAAAIIARRKRATLILVHRTELLRQWQERLTEFLDMPKGLPGVMGGGKKKPSGKIDIAVLQSLVRLEHPAEFLEGYGQIIVDECHHMSAFSFEGIIKQAKARFVMGLTATPIRRDGHQPIIHMQCGSIRHQAVSAETAPTQLEVWPQYLSAPEIPPGASIQDIFRILSTDARRTRRIISNVLEAYRSGRKILLLTERTDHLNLLHTEMIGKIEHCFVLHGRLSRKKRVNVLAQLAALNDRTPRVLLATGRLIGEGFDYPPLDTLVLAMPISWKGTLQQYAGRLHREHAGKQDVRIYDYVENDQPQLAHMWNKRQRGYHAMGYQILQSDVYETLLL